MQNISNNPSLSLSETNKGEKAKKRSLSISVKIIGLSSFLLFAAILIMTILCINNMKKLSLETANAVAKSELVEMAKVNDIIAKGSSRLVLEIIIAAVAILLVSFLLNFSALRALIINPVKKIVDVLKQMEAGIFLSGYNLHRTTKLAK